MPDEDPQNPFTMLAANAALLHEMYVSLVTAGFSEAQALYLVAQMCLGGKGSPPA